MNGGQWIDLRDSVLEIEIHGSIRFRTPPVKPFVQSVKFTKKVGSQMTGTVQLSPLVPADNVTSRQVVVTVNGTALPAIEAIATPATFSCAVGDAITVIDTDINSVGSSTPSGVFSITASVPASVPTQPSVLGVTFAP